jgi:hypothetical protein
VFYEAYDGIREAIAREKQIKGGSRQKKIDLIKGLNPTIGAISMMIYEIASSPSSAPYRPSDSAVQVPASSQRRRRSYLLRSATKIIRWFE